MSKSNQTQELIIANNDLQVEIQRLTNELIATTSEISLQKTEKKKREAELKEATSELVIQTNEKSKWVEELAFANEELVFQSSEREKRAEELTQANLARILIEASHDPLFTINPEGKITDLNIASAHITGISREKLIGTDFFDFSFEKMQHGIDRVGHLEGYFLKGHFAGIHFCKIQNVVN